MTFVEIEDKEAYFKEHYFFKNSIPELTEKRTCMHCRQEFTIGDYKVEFSQGREWIVCPNAPRCDGNMKDWFPLR